jgi:DNA polymerase III epsilon subunit-like protein
MVATAPTGPEVAEQYAAIVAGRTVVANSASFDRRLLSLTHNATITRPLADHRLRTLLHGSWDGEWVAKGLTPLTDRRICAAARFANQPIAFAFRKTDHNVGH